MKSSLEYCAVIFTVLLFAGTSNLDTSQVFAAETLTIAGTGTSTGAMQLMAAEFQKKRPAVSVTVLPSIGSSGAIKAVGAGKIDIGLTSRSLKPEEMKEGLAEKTYGRTAFVFAVQDSNPATGFTLDEIEGIYSGKSASWPDGTPLRLVLRPQSDSASAYLGRISPALKAAADKAQSIPGVFVGVTDQDAAIQIEKTAGAFGTTCASVIISEKRKIKALSVEGVSPTLDNVASGKYPYFMATTLVYKADRYNGVVKDFVDFIFAADGQKILHDTGHVTTPQATGD